MSRLDPLLAVLVVSLASGASAQTPLSGFTDSASVYRSACTACHGTEGTGVPAEQSGNIGSVPDFTDCRFASAERTTDWAAIIRNGGPSRAFSRTMPAFRDALSDGEIRLAISHLRSFCRSTAWPSGDLNFPRPLATEKAFPEDETIFSFSAPLQDTDSAELRVTYERRLGATGQFEAEVPWNAREINGQWNRGLGDVSAGYKQLLISSLRTGTLLAGAVGFTLPTGKEQYGLGSRLTVLETSALASQRIGRLFGHGQLGFEFPLNIASTPNEVFWRGALGTTLSPRRDGRVWTPMIELTGHREFEFGDPIRWDVLPQLQVGLSRRQHVNVTVGARLPVGGPSRPSTAVVSVNWDWFEGGLFAGWR